jgi:hypothetical protein
VYKLDEKHEATDIRAAMERSMDVLEEKYPTGILYQIERAAYHEQIDQLTEPLVHRAPNTSIDVFLPHLV